MNNGEIVLKGTPKEVFKQSDLLESIGLGVPQVTYLMKALKKKGFNVSEDAYTIQQAKEELLKLFSTNSREGL